MKNILKISLLITFTAVVFYACKKTKTTEASTASISSLVCSATIFSATATNGVAYNSTGTVPYTGGNAIAYAAGTSIASTGVTGLTATLNAGTLASGNGNIIYALSGTASAAGNANFAISFGGQSCTITLVVNAAGSSSPTVASLTCASLVVSASPTVSTAFIGTATIPYTGGNGLAYTTTTAINSTGVSGLSATLTAGTLASGAGNLTYNISGTPTSSGTANFAISFGGQSCSFSITVNAAATSCSSLSGVSKIVCLANNFLASLSATQQASVILPLNLTNAKRWSNLPCALSCRNGLLFSGLTSTQLAAAKAIAQAAFGTNTGDGYDEFSQIMFADDYLGLTAGGYSSGNYIIAFLGTPSTTGKWMLQVGGHHYAQNITYDAGVVTSITPMHEAVEPKGAFTYNGVTYTGPLESERIAMQEMLGSFSSTELATAKLTTTFSDCLMVPGSTSNTMPATKVGIKASTLSTTAQTKIMAAIGAWVNDVDATTAASFLSIYQSELANTYISYSSNNTAVAGNASSFLVANTDYVRIDGPGVWIEFVCQNGIVASGIHYHTVMRDHTRDYIGL